MCVIVMFNLSNSTVKTVLGFGAAVVGLRVLGNVMRSESFNADSVNEPIYLLHDLSSGMVCLGTESFLRAEMLDTYFYTLYDGQDKDFPEDYDSKPIEEILQEIESSVGQNYPDYYRLEKFDFPDYGYWFEPYISEKDDDMLIVFDEPYAKLDASRAKLGTQKIQMVQGWNKDDKNAESFNADSHMTATPVKQYRISPRYRRSYTYLYDEDPHWENVDDLNERLVEIGFGRNDYFGKYHGMDMSYERMPFQQPVWTNHYEKGDVSWASLASVTPKDAELILSNIKPEHRDEVETYTLDDGNVILSFPWTAEVTETIHYGSE